MDNFKKLLGKRIKILRKEIGISQEKLAELADIDQRTLSHIECGNTFPAHSLQKLSDALKISLSDLFDFEHVDLSASDMKKYIITNLENLNDNDIKTIYRLIKSMR